MDRVVVNEPMKEVWVRMYVDGRSVAGLAIMADDDVLQTKYVASNIYITIASSIGSSLRIVIENVTQNMGTSKSDAYMSQTTTITINDDSDSTAKGTWTSTIVPENVTVDLDCKVVGNSNSIVTAKCYSKTIWNESVFNRIPIYVSSIANGYASFGYDSNANQALFGTSYFETDGQFLVDGWKQHGVSGSGTSLILGNQFTIMYLPKPFVNHWINMGAEVYTGSNCGILVPPDSS